MFPVLQIGPLAVQSPGLILLVSFYLATIVIRNCAKSANLDAGKVENVILLSAGAGLIGARLGFVLQNLDLFTGNWIGVLALNNSMFDVQSGLLFAIIVGVIFLRKYHIPGLIFLDTLSWGGLVFVIGLLLGGFASGNAPGSVTGLAWGVQMAGSVRHPVQVYEIFAISALGVILHSSIRKNAIHLPAGGLFYAIAAIMAGAFLILDIFHEAYVVVFGVRQNQLIAWIILTVSLILLERQYRFERQKVAETGSGENES